MNSRDVVAHGLTAPTVLPDSHSHDVVLCGAVGDVNLSGRNVVLIGTYGGQLLAYTADGVGATSTYSLAWRHEFAHPVYAIRHADVTNDGIDELIVLTLLGVHILQVRGFRGCAKGLGCADAALATPWTGALPICDRRTWAGSKRRRAHASHSCGKWSVCKKK